MPSSSLLHTHLRPQPADPQNRSEPRSQKKNASSAVAQPPLPVALAEDRGEAPRRVAEVAKVTYGAPTFTGTDLRTGLTANSLPLAAPVSRAPSIGSSQSSGVGEEEQDSAESVASSASDVSTGAVADAPAGAPQLRVNGIDLKRCSLADLNPGDIGFVYQRNGRTRRQRLISLGEHITNIFRPRRHGSPHVLHTFIVLHKNEVDKQLLIADAAAGSERQAITRVVIDYKKRIRVRPNATLLFYRAADPNLANRIAKVANHWTNYQGRARNFSSPNAVTSMLHFAHLTKGAGDRALYFATQADKDGPLMRQGANITYNMMCSEFVTNVCIAATLAQWQADKHAAGEKADMDLTGLWKGPAGDTFAVDGRGTPPSVLQARLAQSKAITAVGYIPGSEAAVSTKPPRRLPSWPFFKRKAKRA